jgi:hypothetical protein
MTKEEQIRELREIANSPANRANKPANKVDDVAVMKWLDANRRKATELEEVAIIDAIVKALFYEGVNKITGHGTPVTDVTASKEEKPKEEKPKTDRKAYMRELMQKRRAKA